MNWLIIFILPIFIASVSPVSLFCMQCGNGENIYSREEQKKRSDACNHGLLEPTKCTNASHTVCIVDWYRTGGSSERIVTKRHCGVEMDVKGCTLYNSKLTKKHRRHLITKDNLPKEKNHRQETIHSFVEVCSAECPNGYCDNNSQSSINIFGSIMLIALFNIFH